MRLRRLMGVADQIVASRFSSIDLSNKAVLRQFQCRNGSMRWRQRVIITDVTFTFLPAI
ncbi:hypothetical protein [Enterovibrio nigricans]|uniref:hypothetical protein n=1 Tax=Enterovibrio nigricans TaxID=504469 RepID=UPI001482FEEC|nr:hypothetical protein [Enterovibrio nigricans]